MNSSKGSIYIDMCYSNTLYENKAEGGFGLLAQAIKPSETLEVH